MAGLSTDPPNSPECRSREGPCTFSSTAAIPLYYLHRLPWIGRVTGVLLPTAVHPHWRWRWLDTFDWYTPRYQWKHRYPEVLRWFREAGFTDIPYVADEPICVRGGKTSSAKTT